MMGDKPLSDLFNGWAVMLVADTDFSTQRFSVTSFDYDEDEELEPFESPTPIVEYEETEIDISKLPYHAMEMGWGMLAVSLGALSSVVGGKSQAYQHNTYEDDGHGKQLVPTFSFRFEAGPDGHQDGERL